MIKKRIPKADNAPAITAEQIENFAKGADNVPEKTVLNPNAKRDFKTISVPFNEYEFLELERLANETGRSKLSLIRFAISQLSKKRVLI